MYPMNLWKSPSGSWHLWLNRREHPPNGKRISLRNIAGHTVYDKDEAKEYIKELRQNWHNQKIIELSQGPKHPINIFKDEYLKGRTHLSDNTIRMDKMSLKFFMEVNGKHISIEAIRKIHINLFISVLQGRGVTPTSTNSYLGHLRAAYNTACDLYEIRPIKIKLLKVDKPLPRVLTKDEIDRILKYAQKHDYDMWRIILFAINTGCRRSEIRRLTWQDIRGNNCIVRGKGNKERMVALQKRSREALGAMCDVGPIFTQMHKDGYTKRFKKIARAVGIRGKFHSLRHSAATYMIESGLHIKAVQKILGHADIRTTEIYVNVHNDWLSKEMDKYEI